MDELDLNDRLKFRVKENLSSSYLERWFWPWKKKEIKIQALWNLWIAFK